MKLCSMNKRKEKRTRTVFAALVGLFVGLVTLTLYSGEVMASHGITNPCDDPNAVCPAENVVNTKHNLVHNRDIQIPEAKLTDTTVNGTTEVCIFCHTPHGANIGVGGSGASAGSAPLWNRMLPDDTKYTIYKSPNFDAQGTTPGVPKGVSLACLSCHDGSIALDALINAPGSGGYTPGNNTSGTGGTKVFDAAAGPFVAAADGSLGGEVDQPVGTSLEGVTGRPAAPFPNLERDLSNDHPIGMAMPPPGDTILQGSDPQFRNAYNNADLDGGKAGTNVWYIKGRQADGSPQTLQPDKRDRVRLYPSTGSSDDTQKYVECASCHNPHTPRPVFLRLPKLPGTDISADPRDPNEQSALCLTCHEK